MFYAEILRIVRKRLSRSIVILKSETRIVRTARYGFDSLSKTVTLFSSRGRGEQRAIAPFNDPWLSPLTSTSRRNDSWRHVRISGQIRAASFARLFSPISRGDLDRTLGQMLPSRISGSVPAADATLFVGAPRGARRLELKGSMTREFGNARPTWVS